MNRGIIKKITIKLVSLILLLVVLNYIYKFFFYEKDLQRYSDVINLVRAVPNDVDIVYIGESSNNSFRDDDIDKRPISALISDYFPDLKIYDITKPASHSGIYKILLQNIPEESQVKTIIVTLNLRSFNTVWIHSKLETSLQKSMVLLKPYPPIVNRFLLSFKAYDIKTEEERVRQIKEIWEKDTLHFPYKFPFKNVLEWDKWMSKTGIKGADGKRDWDKTSLACQYIKTYGFQIDTMNNPRIKDFDKIISLAKMRGWNLVFNLLAENTEKAKKLVGKDIVFLMKENGDILKKYFQNRGISVVDNLNVIPDDQFINQNWTTEHYAENGRKLIAKNVASALKRFYPDMYKKVEYSNILQTSFFNNCEDGVIWGQMSSVTSETSFSGNKSSKTGNGIKYSIVFLYPLKLIPDSLKNEIDIAFKVKPESDSHNGALIIQAKGKNFKNFSQSFSLKGQINQVGKWQDFHQTFIIPDSIKNADLIKIYLFNPSNNIIYLDDFKIDFE